MSTSPPEELGTLVGAGASVSELAQLGRADAALRATPPPPEIGESLTARVLAIPDRSGGSGRRRLLAGLALAAALAAATFGIGLWLGGDGGGGRSLTEEVTLAATADAPEGAEMVLHVLPVDEAGNWPMAADVRGLEPLPDGGYYEVWLTQDGALAMACGRFVVDENGRAKDVWLNGPYDFAEFDRWVVVAQLPGAQPSPWLLDGPVLASA